MKVKESPLRKNIQTISSLILPVMLILGVIWPPLGLGVMLMMGAFLVLSFFKGRLWCGYMCPRGSFLERWYSKISLNKKIPAVFKSPVVRWGMVGVMSAMMGFQLIQNWGDLYAMGAVFIRICIITSVIAFVTGFFFKPRTWCSFCPMGTLQGVLGGKKNPVKIESACTNCKLCDKVCPVGAEPSKYKKDGLVSSVSCIKCGNCALNCPRKAITMDEQIKKAA